MTAGLLTRPPASGAESGAGGGAPARRAVLRWAWRLFRRDWRQQALVLALLTLAVGATVLGAAVATNTPPARSTGFGTAGHLVAFSGSPAELAADVAAVRSRFGTAEAIQSRRLATGTVGEALVRSQDPGGPYGAPMLALRAGRFPTAAGEVALTPDLAATYDLTIGGTWSDHGHSYRVVGLVENPQNLLDAFALVAPGQLADPERTVVLFDATEPELAAASFPGGAVAQSPPASVGLDPAVVVFIVAAFGLLFVGLVAVAGFATLAQRRMRALAALAALGATDRHITLVMVADGAAVGMIAAGAGAVLGLAGWGAFRPHLEATAHHRIAWADLPWWLVATALVLAVLTSLAAALRPARQVARLPVVSALSGRPAAPRPVHRSAVPGAVLLAAGLALLAASGGWGSPHSRDTLFKVLGILAVGVGVLLFAPAGVSVLGAASRRMPVAGRLALRDVARYRARSGPALAAISFAVLIAVFVSLVATGRYADPLDYFGPNLDSDQMVVYAPGSAPGAPGPGPKPTAQQATSADLTATATSISAALGGAGLLPLTTTDAVLVEVTDRGYFSYPGITYVATPDVLRHYGIDPATVDPRALLVTSRRGLDRLDNTQLAVSPGESADPCPVATCVAQPRVQRLAGLPTGASAPNLLLTQHALDVLHIRPTPVSWLITAQHALDAGAINSARQMATATGMTIETKSAAPSLSQLRDDATVAGIVVALAVLAMTVGLVRGEAAGDVRTLAANGARGRTRRGIVAFTAGALGLAGAVLGTVVAYLASLALFHNEVAARMAQVPVFDLVLVVVGLPVVAAVGGWLLVGKEPRAVSRQSIE
jgi:putative ABC transport system permease protein